MRALYYDKWKNLFSFRSEAQILDTEVLFMNIDIAKDYARLHGYDSVCEYLDGEFVEQHFIN